MKRTLLALVFVCAALGQSEISLSEIGRIKSEAFDRSKVMENLEYLTDVYGPRLTGSPEYQQAAEWTVKRLAGYGISNVHLEKWPFGRSWSVGRFSVELVEPRYALLDAAPLAWSAGTNGPVSGELILTPTGASTFDPDKNAQNLEAYRKQWSGKLKGKIVLLGEAKPPKPETTAAFKRYTDADLAERASAPEPVPVSKIKISELKFPDDEDALMKMLLGLPDSVTEQIWLKNHTIQESRAKFLRDEGVVAVLRPDSRAHAGMTFAESAGPYQVNDPLAPPTFALTAEDYNRIARMLEKHVPLKLRVNLDAKTSDTPVDGSNIIGEIPGSGPHKDEIVMIGAHFDSWHAGTGATDNGAGSAVMIEVMRVLKALDLKLDRTVRIGLWGGEEQGYLGSRAYVKEHFGDPKTMKLTAGHAKLSGYFNLDNGSGKIRGVYLQGNDAMRPLFEKWLAPFRDLGATTISIRDTGGTDHLSFDAVGLPGFQFIQDPLDYFSVTHHGSMDTYDHAVPGDLMQASAVIAALVCDAANAPERLPRKELPQAQQ